MRTPPRSIPCSTARLHCFYLRTSGHCQDFSPFHCSNSARPRAYASASAFSPACLLLPPSLSSFFFFLFPSILSKHFPSKFLTHTSASALIRCSLSYSHFQESQQAASLSFYVLFLSSSHLRFSSVPAVKAPPLLLLPTPPTSYFFPHTHFGCDDSVDVAKNTRVLKRAD